jgi:hypothetical protein
MDTWPLMNKNKVEDSQIILHVKEFTTLEDEKVKKIAQRVCIILIIWFFPSLKRSEATRPLEYITHI